jgi:integrase
LLRSHIDPAFGTRSLADIKEPHVRQWRKNLLEAGVSAVTAAKAYRLLKAVGGRYRALVLLAVFGSLRWGELAALRRCDIDIHARTVRIFRQLSEQRGGGFAFGSPSRTPVGGWWPFPR